jgi:hypothetical protein
MSNKQQKGKASFHLFELQELATTVVCDLTRSAVALRERAAEAQTISERDALRYEAEEFVLKARKVISRTYGDTDRAIEIEELVDQAVSAIQMP